MDYEKFFSERLAKLRLKTGASARDMSISMGQSPGYVNKIENRQNMPSMSGFFSICEYLNISPKEFFDEQTENPCYIKKIEEKLELLSERQLRAVDMMMDAMTEKK